MTQFACSVILHASAIRLCWRSIKAANKWSASDPTSLAFDDVEIPQLWTLLAFHTVYAGVAERLVSWLPFYYYGKMLLLLVTFVVPGTRFPNYWFTELLVPSIIKLHAALDLDWRTYLVHQLRYLPLLLLDMLFVPGILGDTNDDDGDEAERRDQHTGTRSTSSASVSAAAAEAEVDASELQSPSKSRSRIVASGLKLRTFSREHTFRTPSKLSASLRRRNVLEPLAATPTISSLLPRTPATAATAHGNRSRRRRHRTPHEKFRKVLCGDENIRIRDFLFDLNMPIRGSEEAGYLYGERQGVVVSRSADRDGEERHRKKEAESRRRRRTFGGALMRSEDFLASFAKGDENQVGEESTNDATKRVGRNGNSNGSSVSSAGRTTARRSRRIAKKQKQSET